MTDTADMHFQVKGSADAPYLLKVYGFGEAFRIFCNCPAGKKAMAMCKHVAALLMGDIGALTCPSDDVVELARRAQGSAFLKAAFLHQPKPATRARLAKAVLDPSPSGDVSEALAGIVRELQSAGWHVEAGSDGISIYGKTPTGRRKSRHHGMIYRDEDTGRYCVNGIARARAFDDLESAAGMFRAVALATDPSSV